MKVLYPDLQTHYEYEELIEHFYLQNEELEFINRFRAMLIGKWSRSC